MIQIVIDKREHKIMEYIVNSRIKDTLQPYIAIHYDVLTIGDILIKYEDKIQAIIERKTIADLMASIKDGRYAEQSLRLQNDETHNHNIIYLIEGIFSTLSRKEHQIVNSTLTSLALFKGFSLMKTNSIAETTHFIFDFADKVYRGIKNGKNIHYTNTIGEGESTSSVSSTYCNVIKSVKKENITRENIGEIMLMQIPGISTTIATAILANYRDFHHFMSEINTNPSCLDNMKYESKGKARKINKNCIDSIKSFLVSDSSATATNE